MSARSRPKSRWSLHPLRYKLKAQRIWAWGAARIPNPLSFQFVPKGVLSYEVVVLELFPKRGTLIGILSPLKSMILKWGTATLFHIHTRKFTTAVHGHAPRTRTLIARHGQDTTAGRNTNIYAATPPKSDTISKCSTKFCARGSFWAHTAPNTAHMREQSGRRTCRPRCRREPAREAKGCEVVCP